MVAAKVMENLGGSLVVTTPLGTFAVPGLATLLAGSNAALVLRPEGLEQRARLDADSFAATVKAVVFLGRGYMVTAEAADLNVRYVAETAPEVGSSTNLRVLLEKSFVTATVD